MTEREIFFIRYRDGTYVGNIQKKVEFERARLFPNKTALTMHLKENPKIDPYDLLSFEIEEPEDV